MKRHYRHFSNPTIKFLGFGQRLSIAQTNPRDVIRTRLQSGMWVFTSSSAFLIIHIICFGAWLRITITVIRTTQLLNETNSCFVFLKIRAKNVCTNIQEIQKNQWAAYGGCSALGSRACTIRWYVLISVLTYTITWYKMSLDNESDNQNSTFATHTNKRCNIENVKNKRQPPNCGSG